LSDRLTICGVGVPRDDGVAPALDPSLLSGLPPCHPWSALLEIGDRQIGVVSEGALRWMALSPEVMVRQLDRISEVAQLPHVSVGVIEWTTPSTVFPMHGWDLYDDRAAVVGTETATAPITDRRDLEQYQKLFMDLATLASGTDLSRSLDRIRADYSALTRS
jgi:hypothetical protein